MTDLRRLPASYADGGPVTVQTADERKARLLAPLDEIPLSADEQRLVAWLSTWDVWTVDTAVGLLRKCRKAEIPLDERIAPR